MTDNLYPVRQNTHLNRLTDIITFMIDSITEAFFNSRIRIIKKPICLSLIRDLYDLFLNNTVLNILQCFAKLLMQRSFENFFDDPVSAQIIRKLNHINLCIRKKPLRLHAEKHQPNIFRFRIFRQSIYNVHIPT